MEKNLLAPETAGIRKSWRRHLAGPGRPGFHVQAVAEQDGRGDRGHDRRNPVLAFLHAQIGIDDTDHRLRLPIQRQQQIVDQGGRAPGNGTGTAIGRDELDLRIAIGQ